MERSLKPMLMECCEHDLERLENLLDSLTEDELRIINETDDISVIVKIRDSVENDLNDSAKSLEMDD